MSLIFNFVNDNGQRDACELNEAFFRLIAITQDDGVTPYPLTNVTGRMQVRKSKDGPVLLDFATPEVLVGDPPDEVAIGGMTIAAPAGTITLSKTVTELTAALGIDDGLYLYDLVLTKDSKPARVLEGIFQATQGVTR